MQVSISDFNSNSQAIDLSEGQVLCIVGTNGSGKSSLILDWAKRATTPQPVLSGNREVAFTDSKVNLSPSETQNYGQNGWNIVRGREARTKRGYHNNQSWLNALLARLNDFGNHCIREEVEAHRNLNSDRAAEAKELDPIVQINQVFESIGLSLVLSVDRNANYLVTKGSIAKNYGINQMSDGERAALILIATAILAESGQTITVDEPEKHMHRSVSSPLLRELFRRRRDLIWIIATHDVALLKDFADAKLLVLYEYDGIGWKFDFLESTSDLPDDIVDAIYGARNKVLFVEGKDEGSLDKPLYQILFPETTIKPRGSCNEVQRSVEALNSVGALNSMEARGLVDADNREDAKALKSTTVARLGVYAVESLYFHPSVVEAVAAVQGKAADVAQVLHQASGKVSDDRLKEDAQNYAERALRAHLLGNPPKLANLKESNGAFQINISAFKSLEDDLLHEMTQAKATNNWEELVRLVRIKGTQAPKFIRDSLGLTQNGYCEQARRVIARNDNVRAAILRLVPNPFS